MNKEMSLVKNTLIYAIGNISTKILAYIMVMVYSHYITPDELGYYDIIISSISLLVPIVMMEIHEGVYRLLIENDESEKNAIIGSSFKLLLLITIFWELVLIIISAFFFIELAYLIALYSFTYIIYVYLITVVRGYADNKFYATIGVINSFITLLIELAGIVILNQGISAIFMAMSIANFTCILIILCKRINILKSMFLHYNCNILKEILQYSIPLIPTTICWWIVDACDRYIILFSLGKKYNGIYAMSVKFPTLITTLTSIFYLAWQEAAIKEYRSSSRDLFFTSVFKKYQRLLFSVCLCCIPGIKIAITLFASNEYYSSWMYTGPLFLAAVYMALSGFLGLGYQISKETKRSTFTSLIAAIVNASINIILIKEIGLFAASISTLFAYFILFFIRALDTRKYFTIQYPIKDMIILPLICLLVMASTFVFDSFILTSLVTCFCLVLAIVLNKDLIISLFDKLKTRSL